MYTTRLTIHLTSVRRRLDVVDVLQRLNQSPDGRVPVPYQLLQVIVPAFGMVVPPIPSL